MTSRESPLPNDTSDMRLWSNYVQAQANHASVRLIPASTLAFDVRLADGGWTISLEFQLTEATVDDLEDMEEIWDEFDTLVGDVHWFGDNSRALDISWSYVVVDTIQPINGPGDVYRLYARNPRKQLQCTPADQ